MAPKSLADVLPLYETFLYNEHRAKSAQSTFNQTLTALTRYTLPGWGGPCPQSRKPTQAEVEASQQFMKSITLKQLRSALDIQARVFEERGVSSNSRYTYSSTLKKFIKWAQRQNWWPYPEEQTRKNYARRHWHGHGAATSKKVTTRVQLAPYSLKPEETPPQLQQQLNQFYQFLTQPRWPQRLGSPVRPDVAEGYVIYLRRILGWFYRYARPMYDPEGRICGYSDVADAPPVALDQLSLDLLIPKVKLKYATDKELAFQEANRAAEHIDLWICKFLDFLEFERQSQSYQSQLVTIIGVHALVRFQYHTETQDPRYQNIPAMRMVRRHLSLIKQRENIHKPVSNLEMQWLDLPDVLRKIVKSLTEECHYRASSGHRRSDRAIAQSFQLFTIWALLTFRPPRRQREFRDLKLSLSCPIKRPNNLAKNQVIHPLPPNRADDKEHGYLFKDQDGFWYMDMTPESYKTGATYGHQRLRIPDELVADDKTLYDYLEAFLYGYYLDSKGNWESGGKLAASPSRKGQWQSLRMALNPDHNHVFVQPRNGKCFEAAHFSSLIINSSHRLTGQKVTPHLLRDIFATWFLDQGYTAERIASLAYAMAHNEETLRRIYDRRKPKDKNRPIEEIMVGLVQQYMA
jgi:hypothetical protein